MFIFYFFYLFIFARHQHFVQVKIVLAPENIKREIPDFSIFPRCMQAAEVQQAKL